MDIKGALVIDRSFILSYPEVKMEIKEFEYRRMRQSIDKRIIAEVIKAAKQENIKDAKKRSLGKRILCALRRLSPKRWF